MNTGTAEHLFCATCGIKSFYLPRSHPDGISVNAHCLEPGTVASRRVSPFDYETLSHINGRALESRPSGCYFGKRLRGR